MARYLVVAYRTAQSPELLRALEDIGRHERDSEFSLLVPVDPSGPDPFWQRDADYELAVKRAAGLGTALERSGLKLARTEICRQEVLAGIKREVARHGPYAAIVISTLPLGRSVLLRRNLVQRVQTRFPALRIVHVVCQYPSMPW